MSTFALGPLSHMYMTCHADALRMLQMVPYKIVRANNGDAWVEVSLVPHPARFYTHADSSMRSGVFVMANARLLCMAATPTSFSGDSSPAQRVCTSP